MKKLLALVRPCVAVAALAMLPRVALASSHMDAPLITLDDPANTTDVYAFVATEGSEKYLTTALGVYPFEEPGIGPNIYRFDDNVLYEIHVATGADVAAGRATYSYQFRFHTRFKNRNTTLQAFTGVVQDVNDANQNLVQSYTVTKVNHRTGARTVLGSGVTPPNNQGVVTPKYNIGDDGENLAKPGVNSASALDTYTREAIFNLRQDYKVFAGQRDDGFYADIQGIFDLLNFKGPNKPFDSQGGYNIHVMVLRIPVEDIGGDRQVVGVYATTSRRSVRARGGGADDEAQGSWVQVGRQGNPLFNEGLVALVDKDRYDRTRPTVDRTVFRKYAVNPELAVLLNAVLGTHAITTGRTDIAAIFIPDLIKVDLSTTAARLAGNPNDPGYSRLGIFGGDVLHSLIQNGFGGGTIPGGWPNGRRFGDDVVDIAVCALLSDLRNPSNPTIACDANANIDGVTQNDMIFSKVFPYESTPQNGRHHVHHQ
jgi:Domain of unknown function (DUF4331)